MKRDRAYTPKKIMHVLENHKVELRKFKVKKIGLFGSYLKGSQRTTSDLDFLITLDEETFDNYMGLKFFLEKIFRRKVDLVIEENLKPGLEYVKEEALYAEAY